METLNNCTCAFGAILLLSFANSAPAASPDRIRGLVDPGRTQAVSFNIHHLAQPQFDRGAVDPAMHMDRILILFTLSSAQQADLDQLLADQQNPSSPLFHRWLTPEEFGNRFGLSASDHSKVVVWLASEGLTVNESGRARNWVAFSGSAAQVSRTLHTSLRHFLVEGKTHFANSLDPAVPEALADVVGGFLGLNDFYPKPLVIPVSPAFNSGASHYMVPEDFATIYNLAPLYQAGMDGTGQSIAVAGQSDISLSDIRSFRTRYNLPANDPKLVLFGSDPGGLGGSSNLEADLDLEWAGAIAPKATVYFVYSTSAFNSMVQAISQNVAPIITVSYSACELNASPAYRSIWQQANAQGITILAASGDSGGAGCDTQGSEPLATRGLSAQFPSVQPEVTAVGGTQFVELRFSPFLHPREGVERVGHRGSGGDGRRREPSLSEACLAGRSRCSQRQFSSRPGCSLERSRPRRLLHQLRRNVRRRLRHFGVRAVICRHRGPAEPICGRQRTAGAAGTGKHQPATLPPGAERAIGFSRHRRG
jgi:subtilase family serine protease